jgi:hypothetical protein
MAALTSCQPHLAGLQPKRCVRRQGPLAAKEDLKKKMIKKIRGADIHYPYLSLTKHPRVPPTPPPFHARSSSLAPRRGRARTASRGGAPTTTAKAIAPSPGATTVDADAVRKDEDECILGTYGRGATPVFTHGLGCKMWDTAGKEYLDFTAGIAVNCLGHSDPAWVVGAGEGGGYVRLSLWTSRAYFFCTNTLQNSSTHFTFTHPQVHSLLATEASYNIPTDADSHPQRLSPRDG